jgi:hypothetical protein
LVAAQAAEESIRVERVENLELNIGLTRTLLQDVVEPGRGVEVSISGQVVVPVGDDLREVMSDGLGTTPSTVDRSELWKANATLTIPIGASGKIPLSVTYTNDSDSLTDQGFVEGRIGISWDFAAITKALKNLKGS